MQVQVLRDEQAYTVELHSQVIATVVKERNDLAEQLKAANEVSTGIGDSSHIEEENSEIKLPDSQLSGAMKEDVSPAVSAVLVERPQLFLEGMKDRVDSPPDSPSPRNPMEKSALASRAQLWELQGALRKALQSKPISRSQTVATSPEPPVRSPPPPPPPSPYQHMARAIPARNCSSPPVCHRHLAAYSPMSASFRNTVGGGELAVVHAAVRGRAVFRPPLAPGAGTPTGPFSPTRMMSGPVPRGSLGGASLIATCPTPARAQAHRHMASAASATTAKTVVATATSPPPAVVRAVSARRAAWRGIPGSGCQERSPSPALGFASSPGPLVARVAVTPGPRYRMTAAPVATVNVITHPPGVSSPMPPMPAGVSVSTVAACGTGSPAVPPGTRQNIVRVRCQQEPIQRFVSAPVGPQLSASHGHCWGSPGGVSPSASFRRTRASPVRSASFQPRPVSPVGRMVSRPVAVITRGDQPIDASVSTLLVATVAEVQGFAASDSSVAVSAKPGFSAACDSSVTVAAKDVCPSVQEVELLHTEPPDMAKAEADAIQEEEDKENLKDAAWISKAMATDVPGANSNREDPETGALKATQLMEIHHVSSAAACLQRHGIRAPNTCR